MAGLRVIKKLSSSSSRKLARGKIWFDDGNIILVSDPGNVAFRTYKGLLERQSDALAALASQSRIAGRLWKDIRSSDVRILS